MAVKEDWISLREFARRRGVNLSAVQKAIESGRVTAVRRADLKDSASRITGIDFTLATEQWNRHTDPVEAAKSGATLGAPAEQLPLESRTEKPAEERGQGTASAEDKDNYYTHRAQREKFAAAAAEREHLEALGLLVSAEEVGEVTHRRYRAIREKLLNIPDRVSAVLAAEKEPARVHAALTAEIKRVLHELSDDAEAEVARGPEERVAA